MLTQEKLRKSQKSLSKTLERLKKLRRLLAIGEVERVAVCPGCGEPVDASDDSLEALQCGNEDCKKVFYPHQSAHNERFRNGNRINEADSYVQLNRNINRLKEWLEEKKGIRLVKCQSCGLQIRIRGKDDRDCCPCCGWKIRGSDR